MEKHVNKFEEEAVKDLKIGTVTIGSFKLSLRETMNKTTHSTNAEIEFIEQNIDGRINRYWDGSFHLKGEFNKKEWQLELYTNPWAKAVNKYREYLDSSEKLSILVRTRLET